MDLRDHIDLVVKLGIPLKEAVTTNYEMGCAREERDLSQLKKRELNILLKEKLISQKQYDKYAGKRTRKKK